MGTNVIRGRTTPLLSTPQEMGVLGLGQPDLDRERKFFSHEEFASKAVDELMRRACLSLASEFGLLARRID